MNLTSYFTTANAPATGLNPTISVWELDGTNVVNAQSMIEIAGGFYYYNFSTYDHTVEYVIQGYASTLQPSEQYVIGSNDVDSQRTQGVMKQILGMVQSNFNMSGQTYDSEGRLEFATINTYPTAVDTENGTNSLHSYTVDAVYDGSGNLTDYKVKDV